MKREIIHIDEDRCTGCGLCIPNCPEGALQVIDGKVRLVSDLFCDGLGACIGHCPEDAITVEVRDAEPYDERRVMENIVTRGPNVIKAHLEHLRDHGEEELLSQALAVLDEKNMDVEWAPVKEPVHAGCPGSRAMTLNHQETATDPDTRSGTRPSELAHWPVQLHLIPPTAPHFRGTDLLLCADCVAYAAGDFHRDFLKGKTLTIACPKLDQGQEVYAQKLVALIDQAQIASLTVATMEVPCCRGLLMLAERAVSQTERKIPVNSIVVGINGKVLQNKNIGAAV